MQGELFPGLVYHLRVLINNWKVTVPLPSQEWAQLWLSARLTS